MRECSWRELPEGSGVCALVSPHKPSQTTNHVLPKQHVIVGKITRTTLAFKHASEWRPGGWILLTVLTVLTAATYKSKRFETMLKSVPWFQHGTIISLHTRCFKTNLNNKNKNALLPKISGQDLLNWLSQFNLKVRLRCAHPSPEELNLLEPKRKISTSQLS